MSKKQDLIAKIKKKSAKPDGGSAGAAAGATAAPARPAKAAPAAKKAESANPWVNVTHENPNAKLRMFTFHYAGGAKSLYRDWYKDLPRDVEICAIQLPGREDRLNETPYRDFFPMIQAATKAIMPYLDRPYVVFGHCMGGLTGFEVVRQLRRQSAELPLHFFVSSFIGPQIPKPERRSIIFNIPEGMVDDFFVELGGTPQEVLDNLGLMTLARVVMDADLDLLRSYEYIDEEPLDLPITTFGAVQDKLVIVDEIEQWKKQTTKGYELTMYPGNHFYMQMHRAYLMRTLGDRLRKVLAQVG